MARLIRYIVLLGVLALVIALQQCHQEPAARKTGGELAYLNWHDTVDYVGIATCRSCHGAIHKTYVETGMGQSLGVADTGKSIAQLAGDSLLYDAHLDLYYHPHWQGNSLLLEEFRLRDNDTVHSLTETIDYVIGSGQHTNSHLIDRGGYFWQAPFTWYAQKGRLDLPPGFEDGANSRFSRPIGLECMSCHNAMPTQFQVGSVNKFREIPTGIDCERCHGPGEAHVRKIQRGDITDTAQEIDPSIVHPGKLPGELQFEVCQRCHLQGNAVLKPGKSFFDFKPGMRLSEVMEVYLPRYSNREDEFIMASHVDRFKQSACFIENPESFNCISCHNPHHKVASVKSQKFNQTCLNCHKQPRKDICSAPLEDRTAVEDNCVSCHMPPSTATDIPHVTVHDHYIRKPSKSKAAQLAESEFLGLYAINAEDPKPESKALAYLQHFERFGARPYLLDSARFFLDRLPQDHDQRLYLETLYHHLAKQPAALVSLMSQEDWQAVDKKLVERESENRHAWTAYRIGEALVKAGQSERARNYFQRAVFLAPFIMDFRNKLAAQYQAAGLRDSARYHYQQILLEQPRHREALNNLGFMWLEKGDAQRAQPLLEEAVRLYPDYLLAWENLAQVYLQVGNQKALKRCLQAVVRLDPANTEARKYLTNLKQAS